MMIRNEVTQIRTKRRSKSFTDMGEVCLLLFMSCYQSPFPIPNGSCRAPPSPLVLEVVVEALDDLGVERVRLLHVLGPDRDQPLLQTAVVHLHSFSARGTNRLNER
jgi:hypothetical protein